MREIAMMNSRVDAKCEDLLVPAPRPSGATV